MDWKEIERLYHLAREKDPAELEGFFRDLGERDAEIAAEVRRLLRDREEAERLLGTPALAQAFESLKEARPTPDLLPASGSDSPLPSPPDDPNAPWPGRTFHHYLIRKKLGQGGMGEVFLAQDTVLEREVALKFLPGDRSLDSQAHKRFLREARTAASLHHPYICHVNEVVETESGRCFIVMEHVEGNTLKQKLLEDPPDLKEALRIASEIAEALEEAHAEGIVHRDLKPANIMLTRGHVKVMDFGLAKRVSYGGEVRRDLTSAVTIEGVTVGTLLYMSPEQVQAREIDRRSDFFSFGTVLYEMLAGRHPFRRRSPMETALAILSEEPPPLPPSVPEVLRRTVGRLLAKAPEDRFESTAQLREALRASREALGFSAEALWKIALRSVPWRLALPWALIPLTAIAAVVATLRIHRPGGDPARPSILRTQFQLPPTERLAHWFRHGLALSPDGQLLAFVSGHPKLGELRQPEKTEIRIRRLDQWQSRPLPGTLNGFQPFFSPDGRWLGFSQWDPESRKFLLRKVGVDGLDAATLCETDLPFGAVWDGERIVFAQKEGGLLEVAATGGTPQKLTELDEIRGEVSHRLPQVLPGGRGIVFTAIDSLNPDWERSRILVHPRAGGESKLLLQGGSDARYLPGGRLVYAAAGRLMAAPFSLEELALTGVPKPVLEGVNHSVHTGGEWYEVGAAQFAVSDAGLLVYAPGGVFPEMKCLVARVDRKGREEVLAVEPRQYVRVRSSRDGRYLALADWYPPGGIWLHDLSRGISRRQTFDRRRADVVWGPQADRLTLAADRNGYLAKRVDSGPDAFERHPPGSRNEGAGTPACWTPDGRWLVFVTFPRQPDIWITSHDGRGRAFQATRFWEAEPACSADGRWLAYVSDESGRFEVYVQRFPQGGTPVQISTKGGWAPTWAPDGTEIYFRFEDGFYAVKISALGDRLAVDPPVELFRGDYVNATPLRSYDVAADGRFVLMKPVDRETWDAQFQEFFPDHVRIDQRWIDEVMRALPR